MAVFENCYGGYGIDFSEKVVEKLEALWDTDKEKFEELTEHIYSKFDWVAGVYTDAPDLYNSFESKEDANKCSLALHKEIRKWFKEMED